MEYKLWGLGCFDSRMRSFHANSRVESSRWHLSKGDDFLPERWRRWVQKPEFCFTDTCKVWVLLLDSLLRLMQGFPLSPHLHCRENQDFPALVWWRLQGVLLTKRTSLWRHYNLLSVHSHYWNSEHHPFAGFSGTVTISLFINATQGGT